jgi:thiol-disulfide isomerase/thioredoxin
MKTKSRMYKTLGASIVLLLLVSSLITIATETYNEKTSLKIVHPSETTSGNQYEGHLRVYVVEIESRWKMENRRPYHYALLDFAYNDDLSITYLDTFEETINWQGDVEEDNVIIMAAVFNPESHNKYADPPFGRPFNAHYVDAAAGATPGNSGSNTVNEEFTHTVFCEEGTATWCPSCPSMANELIDVYESGDYPFYFVAMVVDECSDANSRMGNYNLKWLPTAFYDGGTNVVIGGGHGTSYHEDIIEACGQRDVHELDLTLSVAWLGEENLEINISITNNEALPNEPPEKPTISGSTRAKAGEDHEYTFVTTDPDDDDVYYLVDWGNGENSGWIGPFGSGVDASASHIWDEKGNYEIKVKAKDMDGAESDWEILKVTMPINQRLINLQKFLDMLTNFFLRLEYILDF